MMMSDEIRARTNLAEADAIRQGQDEPTQQRHGYDC
jgi:hypothetical protein